MERVQFLVLLFFKSETQTSCSYRKEFLQYFPSTNYPGQILKAISRTVMVWTLSYQECSFPPKQRNALFIQSSGHLEPPCTEKPFAWVFLLKRFDDGELYGFLL